MRRGLRHWRSAGLQDDPRERIVGVSDATRQLRAQVERLAMLEREQGGATTVLITGETGTGKGLVARTIHDLSAGVQHHFVDVNCAAIPASLLASELFGYEPGAYTDARVAKPGLIEVSDGGVLFLDEIGAMPLELQVMLLKVIEDKSVRRLGGLHPTAIDLRIIAASNADLAAAARRGQFRLDLFYRLDVLTLHIPPLRERPDDILPLARYFLERAARQYGIVKRLTPAAEAWLLSYSWPGNVRELANVLERVVLLQEREEIVGEDLGLAEMSHHHHVAVEVRGGKVSVDFSQGGISLASVERALIVEALNAAGRNWRRAAELLDITFETLRYRMKKYGLRRGR